MVLSQDQNARRSHQVNIYNSSCERVDQFKYFGTTVLDQNSIQQEVKSRLKTGNVCYHSMYNFLSSCLLSKSKNLKIQRNVIMPVGYGIGVKLGRSH